MEVPWGKSNFLQKFELSYHFDQICRNLKMYVSRHLLKNKKTKEIKNKKEVRGKISVEKN